jgi:pyrroloquinoline quinone (PQQ) biosynthesis protein C
MSEGEVEMTTTETKPEVLSPNELIESLEAMRSEHYKSYPHKIRTIDSKDELPRLAAGKLRSHSGGDMNHRFEGERYINCTDKQMRRMQLRKLVDEGGEVSVGGEKVAHPLLSRWESYGYGLTPEQIDEVEKGDCDPTVLIWKGWHVSRDRHYPFPVAIGSGLVGEGETAQFAKLQLEAIEKDAEKYREWGIPDVDKAFLNRKEHSGIDVEHAEFNARVIKAYCTTPRLQEQIREVFVLRMQQRAKIK